MPSLREKLTVLAPIISLISEIQKMPISSDPSEIGAKIQTTVARVRPFVEKRMAEKKAREAGPAKEPELQPA